MRFSYYGHSCFGASIAGKHLLFDPFVTTNPLASKVVAETIPADLILVSHGHEDHILDCEAIAVRTGATVVCNYEIHLWLKARGLSQLRPVNTGGTIDIGYCAIKAFVAHHSSSPFLDARRQLWGASAGLCLPFHRRVFLLQRRQLADHGHAAGAILCAARRIAAAHR